MKASSAISAAVLVVGLLLLTGTSSGSSPTVSALSFSSQEWGLGPERQLSVASNPETDRYHAAATVNTTARQTLVVWHRNGGGFYYIEGRLIDARGMPLGMSPVTIASGQTRVYQPAVVYNATYNQYLVVWMRNSNLDGKTYEIWGKILSANLAEVLPEFHISVNVESNWSPRTAWNSLKNEYMVVWTAFDITGYPSIFPSALIEATIYANGNIIPNRIPVIYNEPPDKMIYPQQVDLVYFPTGDPWGKFMWVWQQVKPGTADNDIWAANIDAQLGGYVWPLIPWKVDDSAYDQSAPRIATTLSNDFMVVWQERSPVSPHDWDIRGREMSQIGTFFGGVNVIAGQGSTDEADPAIAAWPGAVPHYAVAYERQSATGQGIWLAYNNNGAGSLTISNITFWLDNFAVSDYGFWNNSLPGVVTVGPNLQIAYQGVSNTPGDHPHIYTRAWTPYFNLLPMIRR